VAFTGSGTDTVTGFELVDVGVIVVTLGVALAPATVVAAEIVKLPLPVAPA
jgi:hypothetical protein